MWDLIVSVPDHCLSFYFLPSSVFGCISVTYKCEGMFKDIVLVPMAFY